MSTRENRGSKDQSMSKAAKAGVPFYLDGGRPSQIGIYREKWTSRPTTTAQLIRVFTEVIDCSRSRSDGLGLVLILFCRHVDLI